ncbi:hypothetical protein QBC44DRAFT_383742 [Cladorrhinum sp. PSN332]|nr:hypothetical protein QBC44DRAFT_383742 [Cladorrhinum sp. PSN332]
MSLDHISNCKNDLTSLLLQYLTKIRDERDQIVAELKPRIGRREQMRREFRQWIGRNEQDKDLLTAGFRRMFEEINKGIASDEEKLKEVEKVYLERLDRVSKAQKKRDREVAELGARLERRRRVRREIDQLRGRNEQDKDLLEVGLKMMFEEVDKAIASDEKKIEEVEKACLGQLEELDKALRVQAALRCSGSGATLSSVEVKVVDVRSTTSKTGSGKAATPTASFQPLTSILKKIAEAGGYRQVDFKQVFQDGQASAKDVSFIFPWYSKWHIVYCHQHEMLFNDGKDPLGSARLHLESMHPEVKDAAYPGEILKRIGYRVKGCDAFRACENNRFVRAAIREKDPEIVVEYVYDCLTGSWAGAEDGRDRYQEGLVQERAKLDRLDPRNISQMLKVMHAPEWKRWEDQRGGI